MSVCLHVVCGCFQAELSSDSMSPKASDISRLGHPCSLLGPDPLIRKQWTRACVRPLQLGLSDHHMPLMTARCLTAGERGAVGSGRWVCLGSSVARLGIMGCDTGVLLTLESPSS